MSIEAMKRIKSLLQDGDKIDSHTISAVVAECDAVILTQQPATGEPVGWPLMARVWKRESTQEWVLEIAGTLGDTDMNIRHTQPLSVAYENVPGLPAFYTHPAPSVPADVVLDCYDAGILNDFGGGNVEWWQDYLRAELGNAHDFYQSQIDAAKGST